jgi:hypothetical protein
MSNADVQPGKMETQVMRIVAPVGVSAIALLARPYINILVHDILKFLQLILIGAHPTKIENWFQREWSTVPRASGFYRVPCWIDGYSLVTLIVIGKGTCRII